MSTRIRRLITLGSMFFCAVAHSADMGPQRVQNQRGVFYVFAPPAKGKATEYISSRHKLLDELFFREPGKRYEAQISFARHLSEAEVSSLSRRHKFEIRTLNFGWASQTGGHSLQNGESLAAAFSSVMEHYEGLLLDLETSVERRKRSLEEGSSDSAFIDHASELRRSYRLGGVKYIGVLVEGAIESLKFSKTADPSIRLVDLLWTEETDASGASGIRKIPIPLAPNEQ